MSTASILATGKERPAIFTKALWVDIFSSLIILLFVYAAASKLLEYNTFKSQLGQSPFITKFAGLLAWAVPAMEILVALLLTIRKTRLIGLYMSLSIMSMFSAYIFFMINFSYYVPCSCGGILSNMGWIEHLWFNIGFTVLSAAGILLHVTKKTGY